MHLMPVGKSPWFRDLYLAQFQGSYLGCWADLFKLNLQVVCVATWFCIFFHNISCGVLNYGSLISATWWICTVYIEKVRRDGNFLFLHDMCEYMVSWKVFSTMFVEFATYHIYSYCNHFVKESGPSKHQEVAEQEQLSDCNVSINEYAMR